MVARSSSSRSLLKSIFMSWNFSSVATLNQTLIAFATGTRNKSTYYSLSSSLTLQVKLEYCIKKLLFFFIKFEILSSFYAQ